MGGFGILSFSSKNAHTRQEIHTAVGHGAIQVQRLPRYRCSTHFICHASSTDLHRLPLLSLLNSKRSLSLSTMRLSRTARASYLQRGCPAQIHYRPMAGVFLSRSNGGRPYTPCVLLPSSEPKTRGSLHRPKRQNLRRYGFIGAACHSSSQLYNAGQNRTQPALQSA